MTVKLTCDSLTEVKCGTFSLVAVITGNIELDNSLLKRTDRLYIVFASVGWLSRQPIIDGCSNSVKPEIYLFCLQNK